MTKPGTGFIHYSIERIRQSVNDLERECLGHYIAGPKADELRELAERMVNLTKPSKGHLTNGAVAREFKDAA